MQTLWHVIEGPSQADSSCCFRFIPYHFPHVLATRKYYLCSHTSFTRCSFATPDPDPKILGCPKFCKLLLILKEPGEITFLRIILQVHPAAFSEYMIYTFIIALPFQNLISLEFHFVSTLPE